MKNKGFTLVETMIGILGLTLLSMFISGIVISMQNYFLDSRLNLNVEELNSQILLSLTNPNSCYNTFNGINRSGLSTPTNIGDVKSSANSVLYAAGGTYMGNIQVISMQAINYLDNPSAAVPAPYTGSFDLEIRYRVPVPTGGTKDKVRTITIRTELGPAGTPLVQPIASSTHRCSSGVALGFGYDPNRYLRKDRLDDSSKTGDLTIEGDLILMAGVQGQIGTIHSYGGLFTLSDKRFKKNIKKLNISMDDAKAIEGKSFVWKKTDRPDYGFIAQDVEKIVPEIVHSGKYDGMKRLNYAAFIPIVLESVKKMNKEEDEIEKRLQALEGKLGRSAQ